jgi:hypothetical protein
MTTTLRSTALVVLIALSAAQAIAQTAAPTSLPKQQVVIVIDNSGSMEEGAPPSDPLRLRGVAAGLILDALELASDVEAGLVLFSDDAQTDGQFHPPNWVRDRLQASQLPRASGGTNMKAALEKAIAMLSSSSAPTKRIVMITDGMPNPGQEPDILQNLIPHAQHAQIQIFAIGLSRQINQAFLDKVTTPTGGRMLMSDSSDKLLESAKELVGNLDNVFRIGRDHLASDKADYEFDIPQGVDRGRITAILDQPQAFRKDEIELTLTGGTVEDRIYTVDAGGNARVAAWTGFFSTPGHYRLHARTPGGGHRGMLVFVEVLSNLRLSINVSPPGRQFSFGDEIRVDAQAATSAGDIDAKLTGVVRTESGGTIPITFNGKQGTFKVPAVAGRQTIIVTAESEFAHAQETFAYDAGAVAVTLSADPESLSFNNAPLTPAHPEIADEFRVLAHFPSGAARTPVNVWFTSVTPAGRLELTNESGAAIRLGISRYSVPPAGLVVKLRLKIDPNEPLPEKGGKFTGSITISSDVGKTVIVDYTFTLQIPKFELTRSVTATSLWWDPEHERVLSLGRVHTDLTEDSKFFVTIPEEISSEQAKLVTLQLRAGENTPEPERPGGGKLRYGPFDFVAGKDVPLDLVITPVQKQWREMKKSREPFQIQLVSSYGMRRIEKPLFVNLGGASVRPPVIAPIILYGRYAASALINLWLLAAAALAIKRLVGVWRSRRFLAGSVLPFGFGDIHIGLDGAGALVLPNTGSRIDNESLGTVSREGKLQLIKDTSDYLEIPKRPLKTDDVIKIFERDNEGEPRDLWEFEYIGANADGGEIQITNSPLHWTAARVLKRLGVYAVILLCVKFVLTTGVAASLAYRFLPFIEQFYVH